jgi:hypothetical protein
VSLSSTVDYFEVTSSWIEIQIEDPANIKKPWKFLAAIDAFMLEMYLGF